MKVIRGWLLPMSFFVALSGCTMMPDQRVEGLPPLLVTEHVVEPGEIFGHCRGAMSWWHWAALAFPVACANIDFERRTCDIYVATNSPPETVEHERLHCQGYDHGGRIQEAFNSWLQSKEPPVGRMASQAHVNSPR